MSAVATAVMGGVDQCAFCRGPIPPTVHLECEQGPALRRVCSRDCQADLDNELFADRLTGLNDECEEPAPFDL